jgi:hypothetical protein
MPQLTHASREADALAAYTRHAATSPAPPARPPGCSERARPLARWVAAGLHVVLTLADMQRAPLGVGEAPRGRRGVNRCGGLPRSLTRFRCGRLEEACSK